MSMSAEERDRREGHRGDYFMRLAPDRFFVRALLPVKLSDGHEFRFGVWLEITAEACAVVMNAWESREYGTLEFDGKLANAVPPWGSALLDAPCHACVRDHSQLPYVESSTQVALHQVLSTPWPRRECEELVADVWDRPGSHG